MKIINIVASGDLHQPVDLHAFTSLGDIFRFDPAKYHGGYISLHGGKATIYRSGKYIFYGIKYLESLPDLWLEFVQILSSFLDMRVATYPSVQNIVGMVELSRNISLTKICAQYSMENVEYEPEVFPGLVWRGQEGTCLIFSSGKILVMGVKSMEQFERVEADVLSQLDQM